MSSCHQTRYPAATIASLRLAARARSSVLKLRKTCGLPRVGSSDIEPPWSRPAGAILVRRHRRRRQVAVCAEARAAGSEPRRVAILHRCVGSPVSHPYVGICPGLRRTVYETLDAVQAFTLDSQGESLSITSITPFQPPTA